MKNMKLNIAIGSALFVALWAAQTALAWYDPSTGRWLTRDPIGEPGFQVLGRAQPSLQPAGTATARWIRRGRVNQENLYLFVANNPISRLDALGLVQVPIVYGGPAIDGSWMWCIIHPNIHRLVPCHPLDLIACSTTAKNMMGIGMITADDTVFTTGCQLLAWCFATYY